MDKNYAQYLLEETKKNYNLIAQDYVRTRPGFLDDVRVLAKYTNEGERVLDLGCAHGRLFEIFSGKKIDFYGIDFSQELINVAQRLYPEAKFFVADALNLPFPANFFDKVYSISVLHHMPSQEFRQQFIKEAYRVLRPGGLLILRVWDFWRRKEGWWLFFKYAFLKLIGQSQLDFFDVFVPWKNSQGKVLVQRYFHCFTKRSIIKLIEKSDFKIKKVWRAGQGKRANIYLIAQK